MKNPTQDDALPTSPAAAEAALASAPLHGEHVLEYEPSQSQKPSLLRRLGPAGPLAVFATIMPIIGSVFLLAMVVLVSEWLRDLEMVGLVLYSLGFAVLGGLAFVPTYVNSIVGGWAFGFQLGLPAAMAGLLGGTIIADTLARRVTGHRVTQLIHENPKWRAVYKSLLGSGFGKTLLIVSLLRLPPNSPFALTNLVMASARVRRLPFLLGTLLGMMPRTAFTVYVASGLAVLDFKAADQAGTFAVGVVVTLIVIIIIGYLAKRAVEHVTRDGEPAEAESE
jgi:uncharacterized membrane protein YdjX (TVP38/TMEM64 family)